MFFFDTFYAVRYLILIFFIEKVLFYKNHSQILKCNQNFNI